MASLNPIVNPAILDYDPDQHYGDTPSCSSTFDKWYLKVTIKKLLNFHSSNKERWDIVHWMTTYPFVSKEWADPELRRLLERAAERLKISGEVSPDEIDPHACIERPVPSLGLEKVCFSVTKAFDVVPFPTSYEGICLRLGLDPEELWLRVQYLMRIRGIQDAMDNDESLVKDKKEPAPQTVDMFGTDYSDPRVGIRPYTLTEIRKQIQQEIRARDAERRSSTDGQSLDDKLDRAIDWIESVEHDTVMNRDDIDVVYVQLGLDELAVA